jgi:hypothetical protein
VAFSDSEILFEYSNVGLFEIPRRKSKKSSCGYSKLLNRISETTNAPAFKNGFLGIPLSTSSWIRELKAVPEGSTPTLSHILPPRML